jgi:carboxymethylenebutenolidase
MMNQARAVAVALMLCGVAQAQDWARDALAKSPRHGEYVTIAEPGGRKLQAWVVYPEVKDKAPVVVMIHEIFGLSDWAREMADEVASAGYIVVEPDLLSGYGPAPMPTAPGTGCDPMNCAPGQKPGPRSTVLLPQCDGKPCTLQNSGDHGNMQMGAPGGGAAFVPASPGGTAAFPDRNAVVRAVSSLPQEGVLADLDAAAGYGKKLPSASGKLYVAGFCWGGGNSFLFATHRKDLSAAFVFYGPPPPAGAMKNITAPVYGFYAGNDARITATVPQTVLDMKAAGKVFEPVTYDGAGHGFMRAGEAPDAGAANSAARAEAFRRMVGLLGGVR